MSHLPPTPNFNRWTIALEAVLITLALGCLATFHSNPASQTSSNPTNQLQASRVSSF